MKKGFQKNLLVSLVVLVSLMCLFVPIVSAGWFGDFFNKITGNVISSESFNSIDSSEWAQSNPDNSAFIQSGRLKAVGSAGHIGNSGSGITSSQKWELQGNFDIQIDYDSTIQPTSDSSATTVFLVQGDTYSYNLANAKTTNGGYWTYAWTSQGKTFWTNGVGISSLSAAKFRIKRTGNVMTGYQYQNNQWIKFAEISNCDTTNMVVIIQAFNNIASSASDKHPKVPQAYFDNFIINSGTVVSSPHCTPECAGKECGDDGCGSSCGSCEEGETCSDSKGECIDSLIVCEAESDNGLDYYHFGNNIITLYPDQTIFVEDFCLDSETLVEGNCDSDSFYNTTYICPSGCEDGKCTRDFSKYSCFDSDSGSNPFLKGNTILEVDSKLTKNLTDYCVDDGVMEFKCMESGEGFDVLGVFTKCFDSLGNYNGCNDGACAINKNTTSFSLSKGESFSFNNKNITLDDIYSESIDLIIDGKRDIIDFEPNDYRWKRVNGLRIRISGLDYFPYSDYFYDTGHKSKVFLEIKNEENNDDTACADTDNGKDYYTKGECFSSSVGSSSSAKVSDGCIVSNGYNDGWLREVYCDNGGSCNWLDYECPYGCKDGACIKATPVQNDVCQSLIDMVVNPNDININGQEYEASTYNYNYSGQWWIDGESYDYNEYTAYWHTYDSYNYNDEYNYESASISVDLLIFDDSEIDLTKWLEDQTDYRVCEVDSYFDSKNKENIFYICTWDILRNEQDLDNYDYNSRQVFWINDNVVVELYVSSGRSLTDEEVSKIAKTRIYNLLNDLKDNEAEYVSYDNFEISYLARNFIRNLFDSCGSELTLPTIDGTNKTCYPSWDCKIEPVICPEHGYQTRTCIDYGCNRDTREEKIYCSPGICSGCYIPRWFEYDGLDGENNLDNICIPYGARFEVRNEWNSGDLIYEDSDEESLSVLEAIREGDELYLEVYQNNTAYFIWNNVPFILEKDKEYDISKIFSDFMDDELLEMTMTVKKIYYDSSDYNESYVDFIFYFKYKESGSVEIEYLNMYCDIDGEVKKQRVADYNGDWAKCQNNYECESNLCSSGECVEINKLLEEVSGFKEIGVRVLCRFADLFGVQNYNTCIYENLGEGVSGSAGSTQPQMPS